MDQAIEKKSWEPPIDSRILSFETPCGLGDKNN